MEVRAHIAKLGPRARVNHRKSSLRWRGKARILVRGEPPWRLATPVLRRFGHDHADRLCFRDRILPCGMRDRARRKMEVRAHIAKLGPRARVNHRKSSLRWRGKARILVRGEPPWRLATPVLRRFGAPPVPRAPIGGPVADRIRSFPRRVREKPGWRGTFADRSSAA